MDEHMPSAEAILERTKKERPLTVDASVVASFGDLYESLRAYLQNLCKVKTTMNLGPVDSDRSMQESVPVDS
jgi:hypothetical protein